MSKHMPFPLSTLKLCPACEQKPAECRCRFGATRCPYCLQQRRLLDQYEAQLQP